MYAELKRLDGVSLVIRLPCATAQLCEQLKKLEIDTQHESLRIDSADPKITLSSRPGTMESDLLTLISHHETLSHVNLMCAKVLNAPLNLRKAMKEKLRNSEFRSSDDAMSFIRRNTLPEYCFSVNRHGDLIRITRGMEGYIAVNPSGGYKKNRAEADGHNGWMHITKAQEAAMLCGCTYGWHLPGADPLSYDENGELRNIRLLKKGQER